MKRGALEGSVEATNSEIECQFGYKGALPRSTEEVILAK